MKQINFILISILILIFCFGYLACGSSSEAFEKEIELKDLKIKELQTELDTIKSQQTSALAAKTKENEVFKEDSNKAKDELNKTKDELNKTKEGMRELEEKNQKLETQLTDNTNEVNKIKNKITENEKQIEELKKEIESSDSDKNALNVLRMNLEKENIKLHQKIELSHLKNVFGEFRTIFRKFCDYIPSFKPKTFKGKQKSLRIELTENNKKIIKQKLRPARKASAYIKLAKEPNIQK